MSAVIGQEAFFFIHAVALGAALLCLYDLFRVARRLFRHKKGLLAAEDICYWMFSGIMIFRMLYAHNRGVIRWFAVLGVMAGMLLYGWTLGDRLVGGLTRVFLWVRAKLKGPAMLVKKTAQKTGRRIRKFGGKITKLQTSLLHNVKKACTIKSSGGRRKRSRKNGRKKDQRSTIQ